MKILSYRSVAVSALFALACLCMTGGCDSGKKAVDEATGNRAVKQYLGAKDKIERIAVHQTEKYGSALNNGLKGEE